ncbi:hypothetical protein P43SY_009456 [Pythium insidiosum]|uniref:HIT-type domain-containing protein n=1 Tax=Pythium insidiosum TaxID=114742 RepID=A0AAD5M4A8_PYTIN|nr:hypothetical protein P43SY_009456 [Pythium insidiosum]
MAMNDSAADATAVKSDHAQPANAALGKRLREDGQQPAAAAAEQPNEQQPPIACIMCETAAVKYRCPRCERITCSLACCLAHKKQFDCDGKRDRTKYIPLLVQHAGKRGVELTLLAPGMSKRVRNTSYMDTKQSTLFWRVEWEFPRADVPVSLFERRASDSATPFELLAAYLDRRPDNAGVRAKLKAYTGLAWRDEIALLLRKEFTPASQPQFYRLDGNMSLESNLKRKEIVEFPIITVVLAADLDQYPLARDVIEVVSGDAQEVDGADEADEAMAEESSESSIAAVEAQTSSIAETEMVGDPEEPPEDTTNQQ